MKIVYKIIQPLLKVKLLLKVNMLKKIKNNEKIIYLLSPEHGNIGDQAIAFAIKKFLDDSFYNKEIIEFSYDEYNLVKDHLKNILNHKDIIFLHGGGNLGNLYINEEILRRDVIERFKDNKIIIMPQSIYFTQDNVGELELGKTKNIYNRHKNLYIICRENKSFKTAEKIFDKNNVVLSPDSVVYLENYYNQILNRDGVLLALRNDKEKIIDDVRVSQIKKIISSVGESIKYQDTIVKKRVNKKNRAIEFNNMLNTFASSKLVITDRFHGVIFSVITRTPCIVFKSLDHKISEGVKWFKDIEFIYYAENENIEDAIKKLLSIKIDKTDSKLKEKFTKSLENII